MEVCSADCRRARTCATDADRSINEDAKSVLVVYNAAMLGGEDSRRKQGR